MLRRARLLGLTAMRDRYGALPAQSHFRLVQDLCRADSFVSRRGPNLGELCRESLADALASVKSGSDRTPKKTKRG
jgi:hypothetical protein